MRLLVLFLSILFFITADAQKTDLDSLIGLLQSIPEDEAKVDLLNEVAYKTSLFDVDSSFNYAVQALDLATEIGYNSGKARALNIKSNKFQIQKEHLQSILLNNEALSIAKEIGDQKNLARIYNSIAVNYYNMGDQQTAIKNLQLAASASQLTEDTVRSVYTLSNIGFLHLQNNSLDHAEKYLLEAKDLADKSDIQQIKRLVLRHLGSLYAELDNYELSIKYFQKGIKSSVVDNDLLNLAWNKALLGKYLSEKDEFEEGEKNLYEGLKLFEQLKDLENQLQVCSYLSKHYNRKKEYDNAVKTSQGCLEKIGEEGNLKYKAIFLKQLSVAYEGKGDNNNAYKYFKEYKTSNDSILLKEGSLKTIELELKYQLEKKEVENKLLVEEQAKQSVGIKIRNITILSSMILLLLSGLIALLFWRNVKKEQNYSNNLETEVQARTIDLQSANRELSQSNEELERFAYIASHDLKEPVRNIISFTELLEKEIGDVSNDKIDSFLKIIRENSKQMHSLIRDTLEYSKIEGKENLKTLVDLNLTIGNIKSAISDTIQKKSAKIKIVKKLPTIKASETQLFIVFKNLIENGLKYNESDTPLITIDHSVNDREYTFSITDNGIGINPKHYERVFEMYKRLQKKEGWEGTGLGLATCKKIINQMGGNIWLQSKLGQGSTFNFSIPSE